MNIQCPECGYWFRIYVIEDGAKCPCGHCGEWVVMHVTVTLAAEE